MAVVNNNTEIRYGHREGPGKGIEVGVYQTQYFHRLGGKFVTLKNGAATLCRETSALVAGWVDSGRTDDVGGIKSAVKVSSGDEVFMISGLGDVFELPVNEASASLATTSVGKGAGFGITNATYGTIQKAKLQASASPLSIVRVDLTNKTVHVRIKPAAYQAV